MDLFAGTAAAYRQFRSGVPDEVAALLAQAAPRRVPRRLLDLGTGTGFVVRALLPHVDEVAPVPDWKRRPWARDVLPAGDAAEHADVLHEELPD